MCAIAFANAAVREVALVRWWPEERARQLSTVTLILAFAVFLFFVLRRWPPRNSAHALSVGLVWAAMTVAFEFLLGRFGSGLSWREVLAAYDVTGGNLWPAVPAFIAIAPYLYYRSFRAL